MQATACRRSRYVLSLGFLILSSENTRATLLKNQLSYRVLNGLTNGYRLIAANDYAIQGIHDE